MNAKTIFVIIFTILVTIILMKNTDEVTFWIFGEARIPKLAILGFMFAAGFIIGVIVARPRKIKEVYRQDPAYDVVDDDEDDTLPVRKKLSDEDRDYIN